MLTLRLVSVGGVAVSPPEERTISDGAFTIGRGAGNDWELKDPTAVLSKSHCEIRRSDDGWALFDTSTNGVHVNGATEPTRRGELVPLRDGDSLRLGRFIFAVGVQSARPPLSDFDDLLATPTPGFRTPSGRQTPLMSPDRSNSLIAPVEGAFGPLRGPRLGGQPPPTFDDGFLDSDSPATPRRSMGGLLEGDGLLAPSPSPQWMGPTESDHVPMDQMAFRSPAAMASCAPSPVVAGSDLSQGDPLATLDLRGAPRPTASAPSPSLIPDDWEAVSQCAAARTAPIPAEDRLSEKPAPAGEKARAPSPPPTQPTGQPTSQAGRETALEPTAQGAATLPVPAGGKDAAALRAFLEGAGLGDLDPTVLDSEAFLRRAGAIVREAVVGLHGILTARAMVKSTFAVDGTRLQTSGNNPLKFVPHPEDALKRILVDPGLGFLPGIEAVRDGTRDVKMHELALVAGVQVALKGLIDKFDPERLKERLDTSSRLSDLIPGARKARYWEVYELLYGKIARDVEDDFQNAFGAAVAAEYEAKLDEIDKK